MLNYIDNLKEQSIINQVVNDNTKNDQRDSAIYYLLNRALQDSGSLYSCDDVMDALKALLIKIEDATLLPEQIQNAIQEFYISYSLKGISAESLLDAMFHGIQMHCQLTEEELLGIKISISNESYTENLMKPETISSIEYMADFYETLKDIFQDQVEDSSIYRKSEIAYDICLLWEREKIYNLKSKEEILGNFAKYYEGIGCNHFGDESIPTFDQDSGIEEESQITLSYSSMLDKNNIALEKNIFSNHIKIDVTSLFSKEMQKIFQQSYGKHWKEMVCILIKDIENEIVVDAIFQSPDIVERKNSDNKDFSYHMEIENSHGASKYSIPKDKNMLLLKNNEEIVAKTLESFIKKMEHSLKSMGKNFTGKMIDDNSAIIKKNQAFKGRMI